MAGRAQRAISHFDAKLHDSGSHRPWKLLKRKQTRESDDGQQEARDRAVQGLFGEQITDARKKASPGPCERRALLAPL